MIIIGVDYHPEFQQMASVDTDTGEFQEKRLAHPEEAEKFYRALTGKKVRVGMEASGHARSILRFLLVEAAQVTVRSVPEWRSKYFHLALRRGRKIAKVAMARKLAVRLYWMWRQGWNYEQWMKFGSHAGEPGNRHGVL
jgi:hypothetical protein